MDRLRRDAEPLRYGPDLQRATRVLQQPLLDLDRPGLGARQRIVRARDFDGSGERRRGAGEIRRVAVEGGMGSLRDDGWRQVAAGITTPEEVLRVAQS